jgi:hypothetical protein
LSLVRQVSAIRACPANAFALVESPVLCYQMTWRAKSQEESMRPRGLVGPVLGLWVMSLGGLLLHGRIHPPSKDAFNWFATGTLVFNTTILPWMWLYRRTMPWAYIVNITTVVIGVVTMTYFSIVHWKQPLTLWNILMFSTLADSLILCARLPLGQVILRAWRPLPAEEK